MVISYVVRLRPDALADGLFVGEIEAVTSQDRRAIRTVEQMTEFILATMPAQVGDAYGARELIGDEPVKAPRLFREGTQANRTPRGRP